MSKIAAAFSFFVLVIVLAAASCFITIKFLRKDSPQQDFDAHTWLHQKLNLSENEDAQIVATEEIFRPKESALRKELNEANEELARVLLEEKSYSEKVRKVVRKIHRIQGDLQNTTIEHFFNMYEVLNSEQREILLGLATDSLLKPKD